LRHGDLQSHLVRHPRDDGRSEGELDQLVRDVGREAGSAADGPRLTPRQRGVGEPILWWAGPPQNWGHRASLHKRPASLP
jgi:hypothetical protein